MATQQTHQVELTEQSFGGKVGTDREAKKLLGVKLIGFQSKNTPAILGVSPADFPDVDFSQPYSYAQEALASVTYAGLPVYLNHQRPDERGHIRNVQDEVGFVERDYMRADGRYGDVCLYSEGINEGMAAAILERAERAPHNLGFSHVAMGGVEAREGRLVVSEIVNPQSVDLVTKPSTTDTLFESERPPMLKKIRDLLAAKNSKARYYATLREMVDAGEVSPEAEVEAAPEKSDADVIKEAVLNKIKEKLAADPEALQKVLEMLEIDPMGEAINGDGAESSGDDTSEAATEESHRLAQLERMVARQHAENILLRENVEPDEWRVSALMNVEPKIAKKLVESWKGVGVQPVHSPPADAKEGTAAETLKKFQEAASR